MGCPVNITETVIFNGGKPVKILKTTREDNCVNQVRGQISLMELRKHLLAISQDRSKDYQRKVQQIKFEQKALLKKQALERAQKKLQQTTDVLNQDMNSNRSKPNSSLSVKSQTEKEEKQNRPLSRSQADSGVDRTRRDAFLLRFKPGGDYLDKVITESNLFSEMGKHASDPFWKELASMSLTPMVKVGLGELLTFDFVAPCFEHRKPKRGEDPDKYSSMSFYGDVRFDFKQFGTDDETLKKRKPLQFCLKTCHVIGFYLQHLHGFELLKMKVDFYRDEFGEIWLMQADNIFVRKHRPVFAGKGTKVADFVLTYMNELQKAEEKKRKEEEREERKRKESLKPSSDV